MVLLGIRWPWLPVCILSCDITGVVELDLINVKKDIEGGGYVYARNEHGQWHEISHENTLLSLYNMQTVGNCSKNNLIRY